MAIDPATVKMIAQAAFKVATDEEARKKVIMIALIPVISMIIVLTMFFYIISHPIDFLSKTFFGNEFSVVTNMHDDFSIDQNVDINDASFIESNGVDYLGVTLKNGSNVVIYFNQADKRWDSKPYGRTGTIGTSGCGPTALAMIVSSLTATRVDPEQMCTWSYENGYRCEGNGSYHSLIPGGARYFGLKVEGCKESESQKIVDALSKGKLVIAIMSKGNFTKSGHFIVLRGVTSEGKILIADPISKSRSDQEWDISVILSEASKQSSSGGPFWIISK